MKLFNQLKKKIGIFAIIILLFQTAMPIYQNAAFAEGTEPEQEETVDLDNEKGEGDSESDLANEDMENEFSQSDEDNNDSVDSESSELAEESIENKKELEEFDTDTVQSVKEASDDNEEKANVTNALEKETPSATEPKDLGNIFTFESLTKNEDDIEDGEVIDVGDSDLLQIKYLWDTGNQNVNPGDYAEIDIPDSFSLPSAIEDADLIVGDNKKVGTYSIKDGKIRFDFDEGITDFGVVSNGTVNAGARFNLEKFEKDVVEEIVFKDKEDKILTVIGKPKIDIKSINKQGVPDSDKDAKEIIWTVDLMNPSEKAITDALFTDVIPDGLELKDDSIRVNDLTVGLDGTLTQGDSFEVNPTIDGQNLEIPFEKINSYKGYRVEYTTTITDKSATQFTNNAHLVDGNTKLPAESTVNIKRSDSLEKYGKKLDNGNIEWTIDVNKAGGSIAEAIIKDKLPEVLDIESIKIFKLTQDGDNWNESESDKTADDFPVNLGKLTSDDTYRIKVETSIDYSKVNSGDYEKSTEFTNEATLKDGDKELDSDSDKVNIVRKPILSKKGEDVPIVHDDGKKLKWVVTVNEANHDIKNAVITDTLPAGLTIDKADIVVENSEGTNVTNDATITVPSNDGSDSTTVTIDLGNIDEKHTITYFTKVTDFSKDNFKNGVSLGGEGVGEGGAEIEESVPVKPNSDKKRHVGVNYDNKTLDWRASLNPHREAMETLTITDTFPNGGMTLLEDTLIIYKGKENSDKHKLVEGEDYTLSPIKDDNYKNGFEIKFNEDNKNLFPIKEKIYIQYTTSYDPEKDVIPKTGEDGEYKNHVDFKYTTVNGRDVVTEDDAKFTVNEETINSGKKIGNLVSLDEDGNQVNGWHSGNERKLEWEVYTNYLEQDLGTDVTVEDVLGYDGEVDIDNVEVKKYTVNKKGETKLGDAIDASKYDVSATNDVFTLKFNEAVTERYAIVFTTDVPEISKGVYENTATTIVGDNKYPYTGSIDFDKANNHLSKEAIGLDNNEVFTDDEIDWEIKINESLSIVEANVNVTDTISAGMEYKDDSFELYKLEGTKEILVNESEYDLTVNRDTDNGATELKIDFDGSISSTYVMKYKTIVTETDGEVNNQVDFSGSNFDTKTIESEKLTAKQFSSTSGDPTRGEIEVTKVAAHDSDVKLPGAEFEFYYVLNGEKQYVKAEDGSNTHVTKEDGTIDFLGLLTNRTYYLKEVAAPDGYKITNPEVIEINNLQAVGEDRENIYEVKVENTELVNISGEKTWLDNNSDERPDTITVELSGDDEFVEDQEVSEDDEGNWIYEFTDLPRYNEDDTEIEYTINEIEVAGYETEVDGHNITNLRVGTTEVTGEKTWIEEDEQYRPESITVQLLANGKDKTTKEVSQEIDWAYSFTDLPKYDSEGKEIEYTIEELSVPGYDAVVDGHDITNTQQTTELSGTKTWIDNDDAIGDRPDSITVKVMNPTDSDPVQEQEVTAGKDDKWNYTFTDLPKYNQEGEEIEYTITEDVPNGYDVTVDGNDLSNLRTGTTEVSGQKVWKDNNDATGDRPDEITIMLLQNGEEIEKRTVTPDAEGDWTYSFDNLERFDSEGREWGYTVDELTPEGYEKSAGVGKDLVNTRVGKIDVAGEKIWLDNENADDDRPESITIHLLRNGELVAKTTTSAENNWEYSFNHLDRFDSEGREWGYTIDEVTPEGYEKSAGKDYDIVNTRVGETELSGKKIWEDDNDASKDRPESIKVNLLRNGSVIRVEEVTEKDNWKYTFAQLDKFDEKGQLYNYNVKEQGVPGYKSEVDETTITNTRSETTSIEITKGWLDDNSKDRPNSVTVYVYQNDDLFETVTLKAADDWVYELEDLEAYDEDGKAYRYRLEEETVNGYETEINGYNITNLRVGQTELDVNKFWKNDTEDERPNSIQIDLLQNGQVIKTVDLTKENNWSYVFTDLDEFDQEGKAYNYTIEEKAVDGYETSIKETENGFELTNTYSRPDEPTDPDSPEEDDSDDLPQTGEQDNTFLTVLGLLLIILPSIYLYKGRDKRFK